jgi:hypothetical protein
VFQLRTPQPGDRAVIHREGCLPIPVTVSMIDGDGTIALTQSGPWFAYEPGRFTVDATYAPGGLTADDLSGCTLLIDASEGDQ